MKIILQLILILSWTTSIAQANGQQNSETGDFNFDSIPDYRIKNRIDTTKWDYYICNAKTKAFEKDSKLSSLDFAVFDFTKKKFSGSKDIQLSNLIRQTDIYEYVDGVVTMTQRRICRQEYLNSERSDCDYYEFVNGELIYNTTLQGAE